jgi:hypothetical protein
MMLGQEPLQPEADQRTAEHANGGDLTNRR